jgi:hypothetical protein
VGHRPSLFFNQIIKYMNARPSLPPRLAYWGICLIVIAWLAATVLFEMHLGWPVTGIQWCKRLVGWGVEFMLVRALFLSTRRQPFR